MSLIKRGTKVVTTQANPEVTDWTEEALRTRQWGIKGEVICHHDSHGLCYKVCHEDETIGFYDPSEIEVIE